MFERIDVGAILRSYVGLVVLCVALAFGLRLLCGFFVGDLSPGELTTKNDVYLVYASKVVKFVSFGFIVMSIISWMADLNPKDPNKNMHKKAAVVAFVGVAAAALWYFLQVMLYALNVKHGPSLHYIYDNALSMGPILLMALINMFLARRVKAKKLSQGVQNFKLQHGEDSFARFFWLVDFPILVAAGTILALSWVAEFISSAQQLAVMVGGAMAFLVFVTHCLEQVVHRINEFEEGHGPNPVPPPTGS
jgi:MFS family permease